MISEKEFVEFVGQPEFELAICIAEQYPELEENCIRFLIDEYKRFVIVKYVGEVLDEGL